MSDTSIIDAIKTFILTYSGLANGALLLVDHLGTTSVEYAIISLPGPIVIEDYLDDGSFNQFSFALQATLPNSGDKERLGNGEFFEKFRDWLKEQSLSNNLPVISSKKTAVEITAVNAGFVLSEGESGTNVYQITCALYYDQKL